MSASEDFEAAFLAEYSDFNIALQEEAAAAPPEAHAATEGKTTAGATAASSQQRMVDVLTELRGTMAGSERRKRASALFACAIPDPFIEPERSTTNTNSHLVSWN